MRDLGQDTDTVTCLTLCIFTGTVLQIFYNLKCIFHRFTALYSLDIDAGTDTAIVMFKFRAVKRRFRNR